jgi:hypothetical protein
MNGLRIKDRHPLNAIDSLRSGRQNQLFISYWVITLTAGLSMPSEATFLRTSEFIHLHFSALMGLTSIASQSFNQGFVALFMAISLGTFLLLAFVSIFWIPAGSQKIFLDFKSKAILIGITVLIFFAAVYMPFYPYTIKGGTGTSSSLLLFLGSSSKMGALTVLNALFGFTQLFFIVCMRSWITTPVAASN